VLSNVIQYTIARVEAALRLISQLQTSEFPQPNCEDALQEIAEVFQGRLCLISRFDDRTAALIVHTACQEALEKLFELMPYLGFLLRSTNVRNAFEFHAPLERLARKLVPGAKLVLSSEWDFSPFTYPAMPSLPKYVFIGLPASESGNALVLPLAGHELGHAVWANEGLDQRFNPRIVQVLLKEIRARWPDYQVHFPHPTTQDQLENLHGSRTWNPAFRWAAFQLQERFCDQMGVRIFGEAYLRAFAYLLAPGLAARSPEYPSNEARATSLIIACQRWSIPIPDDYASNFRDGPPTLEGASKFLCSVADRVADELSESALEICDKIATDCGISSRDQAGVSAVVAAFEKLVPATEAQSLSTIIDAGWRAVSDSNFWSNYPHLRNRMSEVLNELVLKSVEVFEIEAKLREVKDAPEG
jgi:hypothetical protein